MAFQPRRCHRHGTIAAGFAIVLWLVAAMPAVAHSELVSSSPAAGSTVTAALGMTIVLSFSETLKSGSKAEIVGPDGATVGTATIDAHDDTKLSWASAAALMSGSWTIRWTSIATDGDVLRGTIPFTIAPGSAVPSASPAASASPATSLPPADTPVTGAGVVVPVIAALLVIVILAFGLLRRRRPAA